MKFLPHYFNALNESKQFQVMMLKPDWKCVFTYVQSFYRRFRNGRDPPPPTRVLTLQPEDNQVSKVQSDKSISDKPLSPEKQKSLLSKYMIDDEEEKRSKNRLTKGRISSSPSVSFQASQTTIKKDFENKNRPPLTSSLSLSSYPEKVSGRPDTFRLSSVEEKLTESESSEILSKNKSSGKLSVPNHATSSDHEISSSLSVNSTPPPSPSETSASKN